MMNMNSMVDPLVTEWGEKLKPHAQAIGRRLDAFGWMVLARLDAIVENTSKDSHATGRERLRRAIVAATDVELADVPMGQEWTLEVITCTAGTVTVSDGTGFVLAIQAGDTVSKPDITFPKGSKVIARSDVDTTVFLQFAVKVKQGGRDARTGWQNQAPDGSGVADSPVYRHSPGDVGHKPIVPTGDAAVGGSQGV
jgi:hypothetical protein